MNPLDPDTGGVDDDGRRAQRFPTLTDAQIARIATLAKRRPMLSLIHI